MPAKRLIDPSAGTKTTFEDNGSLPTPRIRDKHQLVQLLVKHEGRVSKVAEECQRSRMQVYRWLEQHGIDPHAYRK